jgi:CheY-like chemotaxis protein/HPt (histidine-containing phosphotransfer) domain-containing protein
VAEFGLQAVRRTARRPFDARLLQPARSAQGCATLERCVLPDDTVPEPAAMTARDPGKQVTVLVADDAAINLKVAGAMLRKLGFEFQTALDGREAVAAVGRAAAVGRPFGAILMDVDMPGMGGLEATRRILDAWGTTAPPVIALTAAVLPEDRVRCAAAGMVDYLTKPLHVAALALALERWVNGSEPSHGGLVRGDLALASPGPALGDPSLMDFSRLEEFREFDDTQQTLTREVVGMFLNDAPRRLRAIDEAIRSGDAGALAVASHALKGAASNIGAIALQAMCDRLEEDSRETVPRDAAIRQAQLQHVWTQTHAALAAWV